MGKERGGNMLRTGGEAAQKTESRDVSAMLGQMEKRESLIDKHSSFNGHYRSTDNLRVEGTVDGEIECEATLTIAEEAKVQAKVAAQNVTVGGILDGEVTCPGRFQILPTGRVTGKVVAGTLEILAGAYYQGDLSMHKPVPKENGKSDLYVSEIADGTFPLAHQTPADRRA